MALSNTKNDNVKFVTILADGKFHLEAEQGAEGAVLREYETSDKKVGSKWEYLFDTLSGMITSLTFREGEYGNQLYLGIDDVVVCMGVSSSYAEDMMKKIPNIDFEKPVTLQPFAFETDTGKTKKGITVTQEGKKITNYFYDAATKKNVNGYPSPAGDTATYSKDQWKMYFMTARLFLVDYITKNHLIEAPKSEADALYENLGRIGYDAAEADALIKKMNENF